MIAKQQPKQRHACNHTAALWQTPYDTLTLTAGTQVQAENHTAENPHGVCLTAAYSGQGVKPNKSHKSGKLAALAKKMKLQPHTNTAVEALANTIE